MLVKFRVKEFESNDIHENAYLYQAINGISAILNLDEKDFMTDKIFLDGVLPSSKSLKNAKLVSPPSYSGHYKGLRFYEGEYQGYRAVVAERSDKNNFAILVVYAKVIRHHRDKDRDESKDEHPDEFYQALKRSSGGRHNMKESFSSTQIKLQEAFERGFKAGFESAKSNLNESNSTNLLTSHMTDEQSYKVMKFNGAHVTGMSALPGESGILRAFSDNNDQIVEVGQDLTEEDFPLIVVNLLGKISGGQEFFFS